MSETLSAVQPAATPASTMAGVLQAMGQQQQSVPEDQRGLADRLKELQEQLENDPSLESDPKFATQMAWLVQDWPKFSGTGQAVQVSPLLHAGLNAMAGQYPGMSNPQVISMLQQTAGIDDRQLVADIRNASVELGALPAEQQTSFLISAGVNALEARATQAGVTPVPQPSPVVQPAPVPEAVPVAPVVAPETVQETVVQPNPAVAQAEPNVADLGRQEEAPSFVVAGENEPTSEELAMRGMSADYANQTAQSVEGAVAAESAAQATSREAAAGTGMAAGDHAPMQGLDNADHGNASAEHAMQDIPFGDDIMGGASAPEPNEATRASTEKPEPHAAPPAQDAGPAGSEQPAHAGMTEDQEDEARRRDAELNQGAQNTPPEPQGDAPKPKQAEQANGQKDRDQTQRQNQEVEGARPETSTTPTEQAQPTAQSQSPQPAQAPVGSLAAHAVSKAASAFKLWGAKHQTASDQRRIDSLVAAVDGNIRMADTRYQDLRQTAAPFFKKMDETAQKEGVKPAALMASMGEGGKHHGLWQEFEKLRLSNDTVGKAYSDLGQTLQDMRRNLGSLQSEASERGATNAQSVLDVEERAGKKAMEMEDVPGRNPGESLIKSIGGALERIMEKVKSRFLALTQGREQGRDTSPSMGA